MSEPCSVNLATDSITDQVRVSTAAIYYDSGPWAPRWQVETFIFSDDQRQATHQRIHGNLRSAPGQPVSTLEARALRAHRHIARNLRERLTR